MSRVGENIYKRKDGRWEGRYVKFRDKSGNYHYGYVYARKYQEVKEKLYILKTTYHSSEGTSEEHKATLQTVCEKPLFSELSIQWLESVKNKVKKATYNRYFNLIHRHILPHIGDCYVAELTNREIEQLIEKMQVTGRLDQTGGLSDKMISDILSVIKRIIKYAGLHRFTTSCVPELVGIRQERKELRILAVEEQRCLSSYLLNNPTPIHLGILLSLYTGVRIGELCALRWEHISLERKSLAVRGTLQRIQNTDETNISKTSVMITQPKSISSIREVPLSEPLLLLCQQMLQENSFFILTGSNQYMEPRRVEYYYSRLLQSLGIKHTTFHALRHTFATRCVEAGVEIKSLSEILGHSNVNITLDRYVHSSMELKRVNIEKISMLT